MRKTKALCVPAFAIVFVVATVYAVVPRKRHHSKVNSQIDESAFELKIA